MEHGLLMLADNSCKQGLYAPGVATYLHVIKNLPVNGEHYDRVKSSLIMALHKWTAVVHQDIDGFQLLIKGYQEALKTCPTDGSLLNDFGELMFRLGYHVESLDYFRRSLTLNPKLLKAQENLDNVCGKVAERWHFRMLNDVSRNSAYQQAIDMAVQQLESTDGCDRNLILDIGTGTGLLSLFVVRSLASRGLCQSNIYSCEESELMFKMATDIIEARNLGDVIKLIHKRSSDLVIPDDIPHRCQLIVTEVFDAGLLGEHVLCTLSHAWKNLMSPDRLSAVIPCGATVYVTAIQSDAIQLQNRYLNNVEGIEMGKVGIACLTSCDWSQCKAASDRHHCQKHDNGDGEDDSSNDDDDDDDDDDRAEPYTSERIDLLRGGYKMLSTPATLFRFNFNDMQEVMTYANGMSCDHVIKIKETGRLDALVVWFDLHLNERLTVTTSPLRTDFEQAKCWEQAVFPVTSDHVKPGEVLHNVLVYPNDTVKITSQISHALYLKCVDVRRGDDSSLLRHCAADSDVMSSVASAGDEKAHGPYEEEHRELGQFEADPCSSDLLPNEIFYVNRESVGKLNNARLTNLCVTSLRSLKQRFIRDAGSKFKLAVMAEDLFMFPIYCLRTGLVDEVYFVGLNQLRRNIVERLLRLNDINLSRVSFQSNSAMSQDCHVLWVDVVHSSGCMQQNILDDMCFARANLLTSDGVVMPAVLRVWGMLINSPTLLCDSSVTADALFEFDDIAARLNQLRMKGHYDIELSTLQYTKLSEPVELLVIDLNRNAIDRSTTDELKNVVCFTACRTSSVTALIYWFELALTDDIVIVTSDEQCHWRKQPFYFMTN